MNDSLRIQIELNNKLRMHFPSLIFWGLKFFLFLKELAQLLKIPISSLPLKNSKGITISKLEKIKKDLDIQIKNLIDVFKYLTLLFIEIKLTSSIISNGVMSDSHSYRVIKI